MNLLDWFIILFLVGALVRGIEVGFVQQFFSTVGFFLGLIAGAWIEGKIINIAHSPDTRTFLALVVTLSSALLMMGLGEYIGWILKSKVSNSSWANKADRFCGALLAVVTVLGAVWMSAAIFRNIPNQKWQRQINSSRVISSLESALPSAPNVLTKLGHLLNPNGFPQVFTGLEPELQTNMPLPDMGELNAAVQKDRESVVKIEGTACGTIVEGSGFVADNGLVVTNAHVVAGMTKPSILDSNGWHQATAISFDKDLDLAILKTNNLAGKPLALNNDTIASGAKLAVLGYPGGGSFTAGPAVLLDSFTAIGRDIYNRGETSRTVYSLKADVQEGNSGGPVIDKYGAVSGVIFAKSTSYDQVGYALTAKDVGQRLEQAKSENRAVSTGQCAQ